MDNKEPLCFISALRLAFSIVLILTLFFLPFSFIYNANISLDSKISSFFSFISTFGIVATIGVYIWQRNDQKKRDNKILNRRKESIKHLIKISVSNFNLYLNRLEAELHGGDMEDITYQLEMIETKYIEKCLIDAKDIDLGMFYSISNLLDAVIEQKDIIKKRVTKKYNDEEDYIQATELQCYHAKEEINFLHDCIIKC
ncbi:hypothetical protein [Morganella morganii]|uniref:hypothetical protein n=1 Tax=Morganella morganii TaxID=582 RepID=UPI00159F3B0A|nr:hypothetical protein [Morganella morganii]MBT0494065.1 hypothetical protein [Morganella morganii subsp. morganii]QLB47566.1 hypothetical protein E7Y21_10660 [Morganella morganii]QWL94391.1 hypothetical protein IZ186_06105 [Morganella morganii subsp. morganii]